MKRLALIFIFALILASAVPVHAATDYYGVSFDGEDDYVEVADSTSLDVSTEFTLIAIAKIDSYPDAGATDIIDKKSAINHGFWLRTDGRIGTEIYNGSNYFSTISSNTLSLGKTYFLTSRFSSSLGVLEVLVDLQSWAKRTDVAGVTVNNSSDPLVIGKNVLNNVYFNGSVYLVLLYNRYLSDTEIQAIYNDPLNPSTDGLVLWLAPDSVDTANDKWTDKSGNENNGTIYNATIEQVSIPKLYVYDANTSEQISYMNVSTALIANNTTTSLIPSIPILPWNETVTLNVSATNYYPKTISTWSGVDTISVYLEPISTNTTTENGSIMSQPTETPSEPTESMFNYTNDYGFFGFRLGDKLMRFQLDEVLPEFFNLTPIFAIFIPLIMSLGIAIASWYYSRNSLVVLGVLAVMNVFFFLLGLEVQLSMIGPLAALIIFLVAWIFWDFYKSKERIGG